MAAYEDVTRRMAVARQGHEAAVPASADEETRKHLKALGYVQ